MKRQTGGTGDDCLITPDHGASIVLSSGKHWCPNQAHDKAKPLEPGLIDKQQAWLDKQAKGGGNGKEAEAQAEAAAS